MILPNDPNDDSFNYRLMHLNQLARLYGEAGPDEWHRTYSAALVTYTDWCELFDLLKTPKGYLQ
jgi:hypothetical protein